MKPPEALHPRFESIHVGDEFVFEETVSFETVKTFAALTGDYNPLHINPDYAARSRFHSNVVHGMLAGSFFSRIIGMICPGRDALYLSQSLEFKAPIFPGDRLSVKAAVTQKIESYQVITLRTEIFVGSELKIRGEARAQFLTGDTHV